MAAMTVVDISGGQLLAQPADKAWNSGTCACLSDADSCCLSCWCPPIQFGQNQERAFRAERRGCCRWALYWLAPLIFGWFCIEILHAMSGYTKCSFICHDALGMHHIDSAQAVLAMDETTTSCEKLCRYPAWCVPAAAAQRASAHETVHAYGMRSRTDARARAHAARPRRVDAGEVFLWIASGLAVAILAGRRRTLLRTQHRIGGSLEQDVMCHCLCGCCSLAQEARQIAHEEMAVLRAEPSGVPHGIAATTYPPMPLGRVENGYAEAAPMYEQATALPTLAQPLAQPVYSMPSGASSYGYVPK
jgi:Cys-rich protein (TIGR01571 family)